MIAAAPHDRQTRERRRVLAGATIGSMVGITPAVSAVFGLFLIPLSTSFGWPRAAISGALGLIAVVAAVTMPFVGRYADRHGARRMLVVGNLAFAAGIALLALSNGSLLRFYLSFAAIAMASTLVSTPILSKLVSDWFDQHRGAALGFSAGFGNGFGSTVIPIMAAVAMTYVGWRGAYVTIATVVVAVGLPVYVFLVRDAPREAVDGGAPAADGVTLGTAMRTRTFWLMIAAIASAAGCMTAIFSHVVPILAERHIGVGTATAVISVYALGTAAWQMVVGFVLDGVPSPRIIIPLYLASIPGTLLLQSGSSIVALLSGGLFLAIGLGTQFSALPYLIGRYFGLKHYGVIIGACYSAVYLAQGFTPILLDHAFDAQGTYHGGLSAICVCLVIGAGLLLFLPPYQRADDLLAAAVPA